MLDDCVRPKGFDSKHLALEATNYCRTKRMHLLYISLYKRASTLTWANRSLLGWQPRGHASALRYLISKLDWKKMARLRKGELPENPPPVPTAESPPPSESKPRKWLNIRNEALWTQLG